MKIIEKIKEEGISLRVANLWTGIMAMLMTVLMIYSTVHLSSTFSEMSRSTEEYISLDKASYDLMEASDYLTEKVQRFTVNGNMEYLDNYFTEAYVTKRREAAIETMAEYPESADALVYLNKAMEASRSLMDREFYAMKLVIEAKGYTDYPEMLNGVKLSEEDEALGPDDKMRLATDMVLGDEYYAQKNEIRSSMKEGLNELDEMIHDKEKNVFDNMHAEIKVDRLIIMFQCLSILLMVWLTSKFGIHPILKSVDKIRNDEQMPIIGANEFRYLARMYNKMYSVYKNSIANLNYKASHDELTGLYNRAGYDLLLSGIDLQSTFLLLIDVDDFKTINDTFGHDIGDSVLTRVAKTLSDHFRSDDYVCRIGGDEFAVFMVHADSTQQKLIEDKLRQINIELAKKDENQSCTSISVGIAHGSQAADPQMLFKHADEALYETKRGGKKGYRFYQVQDQRRTG